MAEEKKRSLMPLVIVLVPTLVGLILGYFIWGAGAGKNKDYKQTLQETINYIASIESKNDELNAKVDSLQTEVSTLKQKEQAPAADTSGAVSSLQQKVNALEGENRRLRQQVQSLTQVANTGRIP